MIHSREIQIVKCEREQRGASTSYEVHTTCTCLIQHALTQYNTCNASWQRVLHPMRYSTTKGGDTRFHPWPTLFVNNIQHLYKRLWALFPLYAIFERSSYHRQDTGLYTPVAAYTWHRASYSRLYKHSWCPFYENKPRGSPSECMAISNLVVIIWATGA